MEMEGKIPDAMLCLAVCCLLFSYNGFITINAFQFINKNNAGKLWLPETHAALCKTNKRIQEPDRLRCQNLCLDNSNCVGISYTNIGIWKHLCYVCLDDTLHLDDNEGFKFYRKPGINKSSYLYGLLKVNYFRQWPLNLQIAKYG